MLSKRSTLTCENVCDELSLYAACKLSKHASGDRCFLDHLNAPHPKSMLWAKVCNHQRSICTRGAFRIFFIVCLFTCLYVASVCLFVGFLLLLLFVVVSAAKLPTFSHQLAKSLTDLTGDILQFCHPAPFRLALLTQVSCIKTRIAQIS